MADVIERNNLKRKKGWKIRRREIAFFIKAQLSAQVATVVDFLATIMLVKFLDIYYLYATFMGSVLGGAVNCIINYGWVFNFQKHKKLPVALKYIFVWGGSILLNTWGIFAVTEWLTDSRWVNELLGYYVKDIFIFSKIVVAIAVALCWNYYLQRTFVFRD